MTENLLLDAILIPDPLADSELGTRDMQLVADTEVRDARIQLVRTSLQRIDIDGEPGLALALSAVYHAPSGARFSHGQIRWRLTTPADARFVDVAPTSVQDAVPVSFTLSRSGKLGVDTSSRTPSANLGHTIKREFTLYHCAVRSSGAASRQAIWTLSENPDTRQGIGHSTQLALTLQGAGPFSIEVQVSGRLIKPGMAGRLSELRDVILGPARGQPSVHRIELQVPSEPAKRSSWFATI